MSSTFDDKSEEVRGDHRYMMTIDDGSRSGRRSQSFVLWIVTVTVCLLLLLLTVIFVANNTNAINHWDTKYEYLLYNLTKDRDALKDEREALRHDQEALKDERDQLKTHYSSISGERDTLRDGQEALRDERNALKQELQALKAEQDGLKTHYSNLTKERDALQSQYNSVTASRNQLQGEVNDLRVQLAAKTCPHGWTMFNDKCYYFSPSGVRETWDKSRQDCQSRGGDLAKPKTRVELTFVSGGNKYTWIGLSDRRHEGRWKWVDGTDLKNKGFWKQGEPNDTNSNEDCAEVEQDAVKLNDSPCSAKFAWVCEA